MKDYRKKRSSLFASSASFFLYILCLLLFSGLTFSSLRLFFFRDGFRPTVFSLRNPPVLEVTSGESKFSPAVFIQETVLLPEEALVFLKYPPSTPLFTRDDINCVYMFSNSSSTTQEEAELTMKVAPVSVDDDYFGSQIVRCPLQPTQPRGMIISLAVKSNNVNYLRAGPMLRWDSLVYEALIDNHDNTTIVFVKGLNLRGGRTSDPSKFKCVFFSPDSDKSRSMLRSDVVSIAQEIVRCKTPPGILDNRTDDSVKVSVRVVGRRTLQTMARPVRRFEPGIRAQKAHEMCVCTMLRNQARFLREWVMYHGQIGVDRWFIYDNNSDDDVEQVIDSLAASGDYAITRHVWPWIKSQEAGFAHCALRARDTCQWVGFIDVDEFFHIPSGSTLLDVVRNTSSISNSTNKSSEDDEVGEIRSSCRSFGPSGLKRAPVRGVTVGYTCRMSGFERHKSIVRPEALDSTLINVVHHFHLRPGYASVSVKQNVMVINHYKYQVWQVFKEKFRMRVATYVSDWQQGQNFGSKDRAPGLGTSAVEPLDWSQRFCEIKDTGLRDRVLDMFTDPETGLLPWQGQAGDESSR